MGNEEIMKLYNKKYIDSAELLTLHYGQLMIMADQDQDGSHTSRDCSLTSYIQLFR